MRKLTSNHIDREITFRFTIIYMGRAEAKIKETLKGTHGESR